MKIAARAVILGTLLWVAGCGQTQTTDTGVASGAAAPALRAAGVTTEAVGPVTVNLNSGWNPVALQAPQTTSATVPPQVPGMIFWNGSAYVAFSPTVANLNQGAAGRRGLFAFATAPTSFSYSGTEDALGGQFSVNAGYNLVSTAQSTAVNGSTLRATVNGQTVGLGSVVLPVFFRVNADNTLTGVNVTAGGQLEPGKPYWVFANSSAVIQWGPAVTAVNPGQGAGGTQVTLSGSGFTGATAVNFGGTSATFNVTSDTQIVATTPTGTGTVPVTVTGPAGTGGGANFTYVVATGPSVSGLQPNSGFRGGTAGVIIRGTRFTGATEVRWGDVPVRFQVLTDTEIIADSPAQGSAEKVDVFVKTPNGTSAASADSVWTYTNGGPPSATPVSGGNPFSPITSRLLVTTEQPGLAAVLGFANPATVSGNTPFLTRLTGTPALSTPRGFGLDAGRGLIYVGDESGNNLYVYANGATATGAATPFKILNPGTRPSGQICYDSGNDRLYVSCFTPGPLGRIAVYDSVSTKATGSAPDRLITGAVGVGFGDAVRGLAFDPVNDRLYACWQGSNNVWVIDNAATATGTVSAGTSRAFTCTGINGPTGLALTDGTVPATQRLYATSAASNQVYGVLNPSTATGNVAPDSTITTTGSPLSAPFGMSLVNDSLYIANRGLGQVIIIDNLAAQTNGAGTVALAPRVLGGAATGLGNTFPSVDQIVVVP